MKNREYFSRETPEQREDRLQKNRKYRRTVVDKTANERAKRYQAKRRALGIVNPKASDAAKKMAYAKRDAWTKANPERVRQHRINAENKRRKDPRQRLSDAVKSGMGHSMRGAKGGRKWEIVVGYSLADLTRYIERQFFGNMSWDNFGTVWHIDHIVPLKHFKGEDFEVKVAWALTNLRPLPKFENIKKGAKRLYLI